VSDSNYHYLTVSCPAKFSDQRTFTLSLISADGTAAQYAINEDPDYCGLDYMFQFLFKGNATLVSSNGASGCPGNVQALFLDNAALPAVAISSSPPVPPSDLHVLSSSVQNGNTNPPANSWSTLVAAQSLGNLRNDWTGPVGLSFTCASNATCRALGRWVTTGNTQPHVVALCSSSWAVLAYATVTTAGATPGTYAYANLTTPYPMSAGTTYFILSQETSGGDQFYDVNSLVQTSVTFSGESSSTSDAIYATGTLPNSITPGGPWGSSGDAYGPVNIQYTVP
jgi:hypothetical protein